MDTCIHIVWAHIYIYSMGIYIYRYMYGYHIYIYMLDMCIYMYIYSNNDDHHCFRAPNIIHLLWILLVTFFFTEVAQGWAPGSSTGRWGGWDGGSPIAWLRKAPNFWFGWWFGTFFIFPYIGNNHPNWLIFFRGVQTTNQWWLVVITMAYLLVNCYIAKCKVHHHRTNG